MTPEESQPEVLERPFTRQEIDEIAYMDAAIYVGVLTLKEAAMTQDNFGGAYLHKSIPFGD